MPASSPPSLEECVIRDLLGPYADAQSFSCNQYIYIYIYRERERRGEKTYYIQTDSCMNACMDRYMYICTEQTNT